MPTVDIDTFVMRYSSAVSLVSHLRLMAESNALQVKRGTQLHRDTALAAAAAYQHMYCDDEEGDSIAATYQVIFMTGWAPSDTTPKAAKRGSATITFSEMAILRNSVIVSQESFVIVLAVNAGPSMMLTEEDKLQGRKQDIVVLVLRFLADYGYSSAYAALCTESGTSLQQADAADNVDLMTIVQEFVDYYYSRFGRYPRLIRRQAPHAQEGFVEVLHRASPDDPPSKLLSYKQPATRARPTQRSSECYRSKRLNTSSMQEEVLYALVGCSDVGWSCRKITKDTRAFLQSQYGIQPNDITLFFKNRSAGSLPCRLSSFDAAATAAAAASLLLDCGNAFDQYQLAMDSDSLLDSDCDAGLDACLQGMAAAVMEVEDGEGSSGCRFSS
eukprot:gene6075-6314_t